MQSTLKAKVKRQKQTMKFTFAFLPRIFLVVATTLHAIVADEESNTTPTRIVDSHHHFLDLKGNGFSSWLGDLFGPLQYFPEQYTADVVDPLADTKTALAGSIHVEVLRKYTHASTRNCCVS